MKNLPEFPHKSRNLCYTIPMKIYLDNCCYNRPYDDQSYLNVSLETQAKLHVQEEIRAGKHELVWSAIEDYENAQNPFEIRRDAIAQSQFR